MLHWMAHVHVDMGSTESTRWVIKTKRHKFDREWVVAVIQQELYVYTGAEGEYDQNTSYTYVNFSKD